MELATALSGTVERIIFQNEQNGFAVFVISLKNKQSTVVKGYVSGLHAGQTVSLQGTWSTHPKFGKQFDAQQCTTQMPSSLLGIQKYLSSGLIKGIGPAYAEKLVNAFGAQVLEIIDKEPDRLKLVPGIGEKRIDAIIAGWKDQKEIANIMVFLQDKNISPAYATKIYKRYGMQSISIVQENPYRLADDIWGIGFKIADQIAQSMGFERDSLKRISAGIIYTISTIVGQGHLYIMLDELRNKALELLELAESDENVAKTKMALHNLYNADKIKLISFEGKHYVSLAAHYFSEKGIAEKIKRLLSYPASCTFDTNLIYQSMRVASGTREILLNEDQQRGIMTAIQSKVSVITGGPGTGKTTLIKKLLSILDENKCNYKLAAPTGRAAKRMSESTRKNAETLHRLLEFDVSTMSFTRTEENALQCDFLIIDEASMIDVFLAYAVLKAVPLNAQIIFIGDVDQLPSVGPGNILKDILASGAVPTVRLEHIFRQAQNSLITINAHKINKGEFPVSVLPDTRRDFIYIKEQEPTNIVAHLEHIFKNGLHKAGINPQNATVLVPMNRGIVGTQRLNHDLQNMLNPSIDNPSITHHSFVFKKGDRVMQIRNNYDKNVFNGDVGILENVNAQDRTLEVSFDERIVLYESTELDELVLAYAISIHKSQGSEYDAAIIPIFMQHFTLLQRNLLYTAITRAKKLCILIGQPKAIAMAVKNNEGLERTTFLKEFLTTDLKAR